MKARPIVGGAGRTPRFEKDRVCAYPGCSTTISVYNPADCCYVHTRPGIFHLRVGRGSDGTNPVR
ncbi:MAG: hypothetical protein ACRDJO_02605 [Actinomycetota bacterium]